LIVASQQVCRLGPPVPGAWLRPARSRASIADQSSSGKWYKSARLAAFITLASGVYRDALVAFALLGRGRKRGPWPRKPQPEGRAAAGDVLR